MQKNDCDISGPYSDNDVAPVFGFNLFSELIVVN